MIIAALKGGLGNQLFQYALGRTLSIIHRSPLKFDLRWYEDEENRVGLTPRNFALRHFRISAPAASRAEIENTRRSEPSRLRRLSRKLSHRPPHWIKEKKYFVFDPAVFRAGRDSYLDGYWQNERYFAGYGKVIRSDLRVTSPIGEKSSQLLNEISGSNSVGIHVRRGDYVTGEIKPEAHHVLSGDYFIDAMQRMAVETPGARFFVFSDDQDWARDNISAMPSMTFIDQHGPNEAHEDLRLMSACKHQIISNSTFSWWAAWLNDHPSRKVIAPARWFVGDAFDVSDLLPQSWERV